MLKLIGTTITPTMGRPVTTIRKPICGKSCGIQKSHQNKSTSFGVFLTMPFLLNLT
jgi:hypothetical protein